MNAIDKFWSFFAENCTVLHDPPDQDRMDELLILLNQIDKRLYYHLGGHNNGTDLILSAEGHPDLMPMLQDLENTSPKIEGWKTVICYSGLALFGERDPKIFPDDVIGEALYIRHRSGDRLWLSRPMDFAVVFPDQKSAASFRESLPMKTVRAELDEYLGAEGYTHEVNVTIDMFPTHASITAMELLLNNLANPSGGRNDGWGAWQVCEEPGA